MDTLAKLLLALLPTATLAQQQPDLYTMRQDAQCRQVLVTCLIDQQPMLMMIDTGATHSVLHRESANRLPHPRKLDPAAVTAKGNAEQQPDILLVTTQTGSRQWKNHPLLVLDLSGVRSLMKEQIDGILGMDILRLMPFTIDQRNGSHWGLPNEATLPQPLQGQRDPAGRIHLPITCNGTTIPMLLDTGCTITHLPQHLWPGGTGNSIRTDISDINGTRTLQTQQAQPADIELAPGIRKHNLTPNLGDETSPALLGMDALEEAILIHKPSEQAWKDTFYLIPQQQPGDPT